MIRRPPRSTLFPTRRSSDLARPHQGRDRPQLPAREPLRPADRPRQRRAHDLLARGQNRQPRGAGRKRSEEHTSELQSRQYLVCRLLLEKKKKKLPELALTHS